MNKKDRHLFDLTIKNIIKNSRKKFVQIDEESEEFHNMIVLTDVLNHLYDFIELTNKKSIHK